MSVNNHSSYEDTDEAAKLLKELRAAIDNNDNVRTVLEDHEEQCADDEGCRQQPPTVSPVRRNSTYSSDGSWIGGGEPFVNKKTAEVVEALRFKTLEAGYNLLMYAANEGKTKSFDSLVKSVKHWLGRRGLVKQLRESDIHEAPLLFQAASSSKFDCFTRVRDEIKNTLGRGELRQQLLAKDLKGKTIVFHAAYSKHDQMFSEVCEMLRKEKGEEQGKESWLVINGEDIESDHREKTLLHHACRCGSMATVKMIIREAKSHGDQFLQSFLHRSDYLGQTAVMNVLRSPERNEVQEKLDMLLELMSPNVKVKAMTQPTETFFSAALVHAVHAGFDQLEIARKTIFDLVKKEQNNPHGDLDLKAALGLGNDSPDNVISKRYGTLLAEAAYGGDIKMLKYVVSMLQSGVVKKGLKGDGKLLATHRGKMKSAIKAFAEHSNDSRTLFKRGTLFTMAIASRNTESLHYVNKLIEEVFHDNPVEIWHQLSGSQASRNNLTLATSVSASIVDGGVFFDYVYGCIEEAANNADKKIEGGAKEEMLKLFVPKEDEMNKPADTPLVQSMSSNNVALFRKVCEMFERISGGKMTLHQMGNQIPKKFYFGVHGAYMSPNVFKINIGDISKKMIIEIVKELKKAERSKNENDRQKEELELSLRLGIITRMAAERGAFHVFRALASNDEPLHLGAIPILLERIGDYEENITDAIMLSVSCARNTFLTSAIVSRYIQKAEVGLPMHIGALCRLQKKIDDLIQEVLSVLPRTVKGVGEAFAIHANALVQFKSNMGAQKNHDRMAIKIGFVTMVRYSDALAPRNSGKITCDVTQSAEIAPKDKTTEAGKRTEDIGAIDPLQHALDRGSKALNFINSPLVLDYLGIKFARSTPSSFSVNPFINNVSGRYYRNSQTNPYAVPIRKEKMTTPDEMMRILQGWEVGDEIGEQRSGYPTFPHATLLPGLQFLLAGIIGKPSAFYEVPAVRFTYELLSYIVMVIFFGVSVFIQDTQKIPWNEIAFYIFVLGMIWREALEFRQAIPERVRPPDQNPTTPLNTPAHQLTSAVRRYLFQDAWNILDTSTITLATATFIFRVIAINENPEVQGSTKSGTTQLGTSFVIAQVLLASTAPLLFARILSLSQIDSALGPMTQIIWTMLSHLARFSVFIVVLISSFALTFYVLLGGCESGNEAYASLSDAHLTMFKAMLGEFEFDDILGNGDCKYPPLTKEAATVLLVLFLVIVAILLMNLLIAVLSTVHAEVYRNAEREFNLARAKIIQQSWRSWYEGRQPPPLNLIMPLAGFVVDLVFEIFSMITGRRERGPISLRKEWNTAIAAIHRILFAFIMGPAAGLMFLALWTISVPWVAWCIMRYFSRNKQKGKLQTQHGQGYVRPLCAAVALSLRWTIALVPAILLSFGYVILAFPLWLCGLWGIGQWWGKRADEVNSPSLESPDDIVLNMNNYPYDENPDFKVNDLVKMTSGLDMEELVTRSKELARRRHDTGDVPDDPEKEPKWFRKN